RRGHVSQRATPQTASGGSSCISESRKRTVERPRSDCSGDCNTKSAHKQAHGRPRESPRRLAHCGCRTPTPAIRVPKGFPRLTLPANWGQIVHGTAEIGALPKQAAPLVGLEFMRCGLRPSPAGETGAGRRVVRAIAFAFALAIGVMSAAEAQIL